MSTQHSGQTPVLSSLESKILPLSFHSKASESSAYRADIDGLRAIAVLSVVFYHAGFAGFSGGFVGVDVFFVISGYLITRIIQADIDSGRFSFRGFYERRIRRIFPALFTVALFCALAAAALFPTQRFLDFARSLLALTGFASNIYFSATAHTGGYFDNTSSPQLLLHSWTLSLEEQFYLLFPVLLLAINRSAKAHKRWLLLALLAASFAWSVWILHKAPVHDFYLLPGRAWELLLGAVVAVHPLPGVKNAWARGSLAFLGLSAIAYAVYTFTGATPFPGVNALFPCVGSLLVLYAGESGSSFLQSALAFRPLVSIGAISYSLYLWHWPLFVLTRYWYADYAQRPERFVVPLFIAVVLALLSFEFIETPLRKRRNDGPAKSAVIRRGLAVSAAFALLGIVILVSHGLPERMRASKLQLIDENYARKLERDDFIACSNYHVEIARYEDARFCKYGNRPKNIMFWGDSHMQQFHPLFEKMLASGQLNGHGIVYALAAACPPAEGLNSTLEPGLQCDTFARYAMRRASEDDIDTVFLIFSPWWELLDNNICVVEAGHCGKRLTGLEAWQRFVPGLTENIRELRQQGKRVIVGLPFPIYNKPIPDFQIMHIMFARLPNEQDYPVQLLPAQRNDQLRAAVIAAGGEVYDPRLVLCPNSQCIYAQDGVSLYADQSHIATSQIGIFHDGMRRALAPPASGDRMTSAPAP